MLVMQESTFLGNLARNPVLKHRRRRYTGAAVGQLLVQPLNVIVQPVVTYFFQPLDSYIAVAYLPVQPLNILNDSAVEDLLV
jgi:hypothetical protein